MTPEKGHGDPTPPLDMRPGASPQPLPELLLPLLQVLPALPNKVQGTLST